MSTHPIRGKTLAFTFSDGKMAQKTFEHAFHKDGSVGFKMAGADGKETTVDKCDVAKVSDDVYAVSYMGPGGYTLTTVLDLASHKLVGFSSNEKEREMTHGTFAVKS